MRPPGFWSKPPERPGWQARTLWPLSLLWRIGGRLRARRPRRRAPVPVLSVGNLTVGGTGKTPLVRALGERLAAQGLSPHVVSRGHGGHLGRERPHRVDPGSDTAAQVGDEPLMLAATLPVWVSRDRAAGAEAAAAAGAGLVILDDGHQTAGIHRDAALVVVDAQTLFGNGRVMPAGPLREPVAEGLARADLVVLVGPAEARAAARPHLPERPAVVGAEIRPERTGLPLEGLPVVAFAGIGRPEKLFATLRAEGAHLLAAHPFPDHHVYAPAVLRRLLAEARGAGAALVTTEKDAVRLPPAFRREVMVLPVRLEPEDWGPIDAIMASLTQAAAKSPR